MHNVEHDVLGPAAIRGSEENRDPLDARYTLRNGGSVAHAYTVYGRDDGARPARTSWCSLMRLGDRRPDVPATTLKRTCKRCARRIADWRRRHACVELPWEPNWGAEVWKLAEEGRERDEHTASMQAILASTRATLASTQAMLDLMDWQDWRRKAGLRMLAVVGEDGSPPTPAPDPPERLAVVIEFPRRA